MNTRRDLLVGSGLAFLAFGQGARAQPQSQSEKIGTIESNSLGMIGPEDDPTFGHLITGRAATVQVVGTGFSRHEEVSRAFRILWDAPRTNDHMELARYFEAASETNKSAKNFSGEFAKYNEEWVDRANPLITSLFGMTGTLPSEGDQTHWCAAFVSFVLYACGKHTMLSALSGAYRNYGEAAIEPQVGDIVVFRRNGEAGDKGFGHVGFFVSQTEDSIRVLGGNQRGETGSSGAVCESDYPIYGRDLTLHSIRQTRPTEFV